MQPVEGVLPNNSQYPETVLARDHPDYIPLPVAQVMYATGVIGLISRYRLAFWERVRLLFTGTLWIEQLSHGGFQPQRPTVYEPLTKADDCYAQKQEKIIEQMRMERVFASVRIQQPPVGSA